MKYLFYLCISPMLLSCVSKSKYVELQQENKGLKGKVEVLDKQVTEFSNQLIEFKRNNEDLARENKELNQKLAEKLDDFMVDPDPSNGEFPNVLDKLAEYKDGQEGLTKFIMQNLQYPKEAKDNNIEGKVYIKFVVDERGVTQHYTIAKSAHPLLDKEALRVLKAANSWKPAEVKNKPVKSEMVIPVIFTLK